METESITAYVSLGSNLGDRAGNLLLAVRGLLEASFTVNKLSAIYETEPVGVRPQSSKVFEYGRGNLHFRHHAFANDGANAANRISSGTQGQIFEKTAHG